MHKADQMTPKERMAAFIKGEPIDRLPAAPFINSVGPKVTGMTLREVRERPENEALVQIECYRRFGNDNLSVDSGLHSVGISLGSKVSNPKTGASAIKEFALKDLNDLESLDIERTIPSRDVKLKGHMIAAEILLEELSEEHNLGFSLHGPFTAASSVYSPEKLMVSIMRNPEGVHKLLRFTTEAIKGICKEFNKLGVSFSINDPVASGTIISAKHYIEFVLPYTKEIIDYIHGIGASVCYHICGDTTKILNEMVDTGTDFLSIDNTVDMEFAKNTVGNRVCLLGNVDPVDIIMLGTPKDVDEGVRSCLVKAYKNPCGYYVASGCDIPFDTPLENVEAFMNSVRKRGKWPLDPKLFM